MNAPSIDPREPVAALARGDGGSSIHRPLRRLGVSARFAHRLRSAVPTSMGRLRPLLSVLYLALLGGFCVYAVSLYLRTTPSLALSVISAGIVFFVYTLNRFTDECEDRENDACKQIFFREHQRLLPAAISVGVLALAGLLILGKLYLYHVALVALGVAYSYPLIPWYHPRRGIAWHRLKEVPVLKNLLVSCLWGVSVIAVPLLFGTVSVADPAGLATLTTALVISTLNNTLFADIRDVAGDRAAGVRTLPVLFGTRCSYLVLAVLDALWISVLIALRQMQLIDTPHTMFLVALAIYPLAYLVTHVTRVLPPAAVEVLSELDLLLFGGGVWLLGR